MEAARLRCLFIFPNAPLASDFTGGASRYLNSYLALNRLACEVHVLRLLEEDSRDRVLRYEERDVTQRDLLRARAASWNDVGYRRTVGFQSRADLLWRAPFQPLRLSSPEVGTLRKPLRDILDKVSPDVVWAEWTLSGALATASELKLPWIYAHHDWSHRVAAIRRAASQRPSYLSDQLLEWSLRRAEIQILKRSTAVVTGSQTEAQEISAAGGRNVEVIPTAYDSVAVPGPERHTEHPARVVHLGSLSTTANYLGLKAYLERVHPKFSTMQKRSFELWVVGDRSRSKPELLKQLTDSGANLTGHLADLGKVLRPFDITIIPYEHNTGTRTKLSLLFNYSQVVITTQAAVAGSSELRNGQNCVVLPSLAEFAEEIASLASDPERRERLGRAAKATFEKHFTLEAQLPAFKRVLSCAFPMR